MLFSTTIDFGRKSNRLGITKNCLYLYVYYQHPKPWHKDTNTGTCRAQKFATRDKIQWRVFLTRTLVSCKLGNKKGNTNTYDGTEIFFITFDVTPIRQQGQMSGLKNVSLFNLESYESRDSTAETLNLFSKYRKQMFMIHKLTFQAQHLGLQVWMKLAYINISEDFDAPIGIEWFVWTTVPNKNKLQDRKFEL